MQYVLDTTKRQQTKNNVNKTWATTGGKDEQNIVLMLKS
jgi:hypothetical protein